MRKKKTKILIFTPMCGRTKIAQIYAEGVLRFIAAAPSDIECQVLAVVSTESDRLLCESYDFDFVQHENKPVGRKFNFGIHHALKHYDFDYVLFISDDDIVSPLAWKYYQKAIKEARNCFGFSKLYFYNSATAQGLLFDYKKQNITSEKLVGCGRFISRQALEKSGYFQKVFTLKSINTNGSLIKPHQNMVFPAYFAQFFIGLKKAKKLSEPYFEFWSDSQNSGLDNQSDMHLLSSGIEPHLIDTKECLMVDIKSDKNIWSFGQYVTLSEPVAPGVVESLFPELLSLKKCI